MRRCVWRLLCVSGRRRSGPRAQGPGQSDVQNNGDTAQAPSIASGLPSDDNGRTLTVGTKIVPPFVVKKDDGYGGLSIELWQKVADQLGLKTRYVKRDLQGLLTGVEQGKLDIAVAALTVTAHREAKLDFTYPFYSSGLAIAVPLQAGNSTWQTAKRFFSWQFLTALMALSAVLLAFGALVWLFERRRNAEEFGGSTLTGLASGFWWAAVTMTTVGYGDKAPRTPGGRLVGLVWMFAAVIIISSFTAAIATSLTVDKLATGIQNVNDLKSARVATVTGSAAAESLQDRGIAFGQRESLDAALADLAAGRVDAVVYDAPLLQYRIREEYANKLTVLSNTFERQDYAFALPQGSPLREPINRAILEYLESDEWQAMKNRYLGQF